MEEKFEEIDKFISETAKKTSTKSYKLSPFKTEIEYMYNKNISFDKPNVKQINS